MEHVTQFFIPIIILLALASASSIVISVFKLKFLPTFATEILIGLLIAHWFNADMKQWGMEGVVEGIYVLSLSMMMFLSGYDVDFDVFKEVKAVDAEKKSPGRINIFRTSIFIFALTILSSAIVAVVINKFFANDKFLGVILLTFVFGSTFAAMVVPILHNEGLAETVIGRIISTIANLSEIVSIGFLTILMIILEVNREYVVIFLLLVIFLVLYRLIRRFKLGKIVDKVAEGIDHLATRIIIVVVLFLVFLSDYAGGEYILGAFFAGMLVRHAQFSPKVVESLARIIYGIFVPLFFILAGTRIDILAFFSEATNLWLVLIFFFAYIVVEVPVFLLLKWYNLNTVLPSMILISCTVIVPIAASHIGLKHGLFDTAFAEAMTLASILVCVLGTIIFTIEFPFGHFKKKYQEQGTSNAQNP